MTPYKQRSCPITRRLAEDLMIRNMADATIDAYTYHVRRLADFIKKPLARATPEDVRTFQLHLIQDKRGITSGNGLLYTAEYVICLHQRGLLTNTLKSQLTKVYESCEHYPGVFSRYPGNTDYQNAIDDYIAVATASYLLDGGEMARRVLAHGRQFNWCWDNSDPEAKFTREGFIGRSPSFIAHVQYCAGEDPPPLHWLAWSISVAASTFSSHQDSWLLSNQLVYVNPQNLVAQYFKYRLKKKWGTPGNIRGQNFQNMEHPIAKFYELGEVTT